MDGHSKVTKQRPRNSEGKKKCKENCCPAFYGGWEVTELKEGKQSKGKVNRLGESRGQTRTYVNQLEFTRQNVNPLCLSLLLTSECRRLADKAGADCCKILHTPGSGLPEAGVNPATSQQRDQPAAPTITPQQSGIQRPAKLF